MPLVVRRIEPVSLGRKKLVFSDATNLTENNLVHSKEECANRTLSNILRQLASLGTVYRLDSNAQAIFRFGIFDSFLADLG